MSENLLQHGLDIVVKVIPTDAEHPIEATAIMLSAAALVAWDRFKFGKTEDQRFTEISNEAQAEESVVQEKKTRRRKGLLPSQLGIVGAGIILASLAAQPKANSDVTQSNTKVAVVEGLSSSMLKTYDLGSPNVSRASAIEQGLLDSGYSGEMSLVQASTVPVITKNLTYDWKNKKLIETPKVDPNDAMISSAIETAASTLSTTQAKEVVVLTDGVVPDSPDQLIAVAKTMKTEGVTVKFVVPGTLTGTYKYNPSAPSTPAAEQAGNFDVFGVKNITQPQTVQSTIEAVDHAITNGKTHHEQHKSYLPIVIGGIMALVGLFKDRKQRRTRYI